MSKLLSIVLTSFLIASPAWISAQTQTESEKAAPKGKWAAFDEYARWSVGLNVGLPFFSGDLRSFSHDKSYWGIMTDVQAGYQITPTIGARLGFGYAHNRAGAKTHELDYVLGPDNYGTYAPNAIETEGNAYYNDLYSKIRMYSFNLNFDINVNNIFRRNPVGERRWVVLVSPGIYLQKFSPKTHYRKGGKEFGANNLWNPFGFGLGGDVALRYKAGKRVDVQLRAGANWITQNNFDGIHAYAPNHRFNSVWHASLGVNFKIGAKKKGDHLMYAPRYVRPAKKCPYADSGRPTGRVIDTIVVKMVPEQQQPQQVVVVANKEIGTLPAIHFVRGNAIIDKQKYAEELATIVVALKNAPEATVDIHGFADRTGTDEINARLSQARAESLKDYLVSRGIDASRIKTVKGMGIDESLQGEDGYSVKARRAEIAK